MIRRVTHAVVIGLVSLFVNCIRTRSGSIDEDKMVTMKAIADLHDRMNAGQFGEIYDNTSEAYRLSRKRSEALAAMRLTRERWGVFREVARSELNVIVAAPVQIRAVYNSSFENGAATELFVFLRETQEPRLAAYEIYPGTITPGTDKP